MMEKATPKVSHAEKARFNSGSYLRLVSGLEPAELNCSPQVLETSIISVRGDLARVFLVFLAGRCHTI
jgi:hypothetical protein